MATKAQTRTFNPPPNWPVPEGFHPYPGWEPDPAWGLPPPGWAMWVTREPKAHPVRNVMLGVSVFLVCAATSCVALVSHGASEGARSRGAGVAPANACAGRSYAGQDRDHDVCADSGGAVDLSGLSVTAGQLNRDAGDRLCTAVSYANGSQGPVSVDPGAWRVQPTSSNDQRRAFARDSNLTSGPLPPGDHRAGTLCFDPLPGAGPFVVTYQSPGSDLRGVWFGTAR